jgi:hypothetical protein
MAKRLPFDPDSARSYLESKGISTAKIKTEAYLKRLTRAAQKREAAGEAIPSRSILRGHPPTKVQHINQDKAKRRREHYYIERSPAMNDEATILRDAGLLAELVGPDTDESKRVQMSRSDLRRLAKQAAPKVDRFYNFVFTGWVTKYPGWSPSADKPKLRHQVARGGMHKTVLQEWLDRKDTDNCVQFANAASGEGITWVDIEMISIPLFYEDSK